jgi:hypothetical protein
MAVWNLAREATALCGAAQVPPELLEATAALQELACAGGADTPADELASRAEELRALGAHRQPSIRLAANGPLLVTNVETRSRLAGPAGRDSSADRVLPLRHFRDEAVLRRQSCPRFRR